MQWIDVPWRIGLLILGVSAVVGCANPAPAAPALLGGRASGLDARPTTESTVTSITPAPSAASTAAAAPALATPTSSPAALSAPPTLPAVTNTPPAARATANPTAPSSATGATSRVYESSVTFAAYPYAGFMQPQTDSAYHLSFPALDWKAYQGSAAVQSTRSEMVRAVVLENEYLRLTFLPSLGGRLFQITYKPTNQTLLYNNAVLKPSPWGPAKQGGWLAAGGMEWALPVSEHGYEWGVPWSYVVSQDSTGVSITLADTTAADRVRASVRVTLPTHSALIQIHPRIENPTAAALRVQFWLNAQVALGGRNVSPNTEFVLPAASVFVHSTGDSRIPSWNIPRDDARGVAAPLGWPLVGSTDLSWYKNWQDYLGVFAAGADRPFVGAYNHDAEIGLARVFPPQVAPGVKLFALGPRFCCRSAYTDDGSDYFEIWGGLPRTFFPDDDVALAAGEAREWDEYWLPFAATGGLSAATRQAVLYVGNDANPVVGAYAPAARTAVLSLLRDGAEVTRWSVKLGPGAPFRAALPAAAGRWQARLMADDGTVLVASQ